MAMTHEICTRSSSGSHLACALRGQDSLFEFRGTEYAHFATFVVSCKVVHISGLPSLTLGLFSRSICFHSFGIAFKTLCHKRKFPKSCFSVSWLGGISLTPFLSCMSLICR